MALQVVARLAAAAAVVALLPRALASPADVAKRAAKKADRREREADEERAIYVAAANDAALALRAASSSACGVSGYLDSKGRFLPPASLEPVCGQPMTTNCTVSYASMTCPAGCGFLAPNHFFACVFECVPADKCSASNTNRAFPNPANRICSPCKVEGCQECSEVDRCKNCHDGFVLSPDGTQCIFQVDEKMNFNLFVSGLKWLVGLCVLLAFTWNCIRGDHSNKEKNMASIMRARRHRHLCKVMDWRLNSKAKVNQRYPLMVNVHKVHILGVGLPLFYNSICFLALVAILFLGVTYAVFSSSGVSAALAATDRSVVSLAALAVQPEQEAPALIVSPLAVCDREAAPRIMTQVRAFATRNFYAIGMLYVVTFLLSLAHCKLQLYCAGRYDAVNRTMADYALRITGLKKSLTDEAGLVKQLQEILGAACQTGKDQEDPTMGAAGGLQEVQIEGVSVCYDYSKVWTAVDAMKDRYIMQMELDVEDRQSALLLADEAELRRQVDADRVQAQQWFEEGSPEKLSSTGQIFLVLTRPKDVEAVWSARAQVKARLAPLAEAPGSVEIYQVFSEPPSVNWWHLYTTTEMTSRRVRRAMAYLLAMIAAVWLLIILPYARFIVWPYSRSGFTAGGTKMQVAGMILGNINMFVSLQIFFTSYGLGFHRKDAVDMMVLAANTTLVLMNTFFNIIMMAVTVFSQSGKEFGPWILLRIESLVALGAEGSLAHSIYSLLHPGTFFVGYLMCIVMAGMVPFVWNSILMKMVYVWRCLPDPMLKGLKVFLPWAGDLTLEEYPFRNAEKGFEPMEIGISWDYSAMIVNPTVCFCMLFFISPYVWQTFLMMLGWTCFYYLFCRYQHLRFCKPCYYTTNRLDSTVNFLWGIPLSVVAAACCSWGMRSGKIPVEDLAFGVRYLAVALAFLASLALWVLSYQLLLNPFEQRDSKEDVQMKYKDAVEDTLYSWFNCNPVYVLKRAYFERPREEAALARTRSGTPVAEAPQERFYEVGKEYLFLPKEQIDLALKDLSDSWEFETHLEHLLRLVGTMAQNPFRAASKKATQVGERALVAVEERLPMLHGQPPSPTAQAKK